MATIINSKPLAVILLGLKHQRRLFPELRKACLNHEGLLFWTPKNKMKNTEKITRWAKGYT